MRKLRRSALMLLTGAFLSLPVPAGGQTAPVLWSKTYGSRTIAAGAVQTPDGGFAIGGSRHYNLGTESDPNWTYYPLLIRTDSAGDTLWTRTYPGGWLTGSGITPSGDGGFVMSLETYGGDAVLIRTDENGNMIWKKTFSGAGTPMATIRAADGGFVMALSYGRWGACLIRTEADGTMRWIKYYATGGCTDVTEVSDGFAFVSRDVLARTNASGDTLWTKSLRGGLADVPYFAAVRETADGGFVAFGRMNNPGVVVRTDRNGTVLWAQPYEPGSDKIWEFRDVVLTADGGFVIVGDISWDASVVRVDSVGQKLWSRSIGGGVQTLATDIVRTADGGFAVAGPYDFNDARTAMAWLVRLGPLAPALIEPPDDTRQSTDVVLRWTPYPGATQYWVQVSDRQDFAGAATNRVSGTEYRAPSLTDLTRYYWRVKATNSPEYSPPWSFDVDASVGVEAASVLPKEFSVSQNYPNPFNPTTTISYDLRQTADVKLALYDLLGREVREHFSGTQPASTYEVSLDAAALPSGVYFYRLDAGEFVETKRMVVVR